MKVGIYFGCFIPLHEGHLKCIKKCRAENEKTILGLCGHDGDRGKGFVPFDDRIILMKWIYGEYKDVTLSVIDDKAVGLKGLFDGPSWEMWCDELFENSGFNPYDKSIEYTWYTGEPSYVRAIKNIYPDHNFKLINRKPFGFETISGTKVRRNPEKYVDQIHPIFVNYLRTQKILPKEPEDE